MEERPALDGRGAGGARLGRAPARPHVDWHADLGRRVVLHVAQDEADLDRAVHALDLGRAHEPVGVAERVHEALNRHGAELEGAVLGVDDPLAVGPLQVGEERVHAHAGRDAVGQGLIGQDPARGDRHVGQGDDRAVLGDSLLEEADHRVADLCLHDVPERLPCSLALEDREDVVQDMPEHAHVGGAHPALDGVEGLDGGVVDLALGGLPAIHRERRVPVELECVGLSEDARRVERLVGGFEVLAHDPAVLPHVQDVGGVRHGQRREHVLDGERA